MTASTTDALATTRRLFRTRQFLSCSSDEYPLPSDDKREFFSSVTPLLLFFSLKESTKLFRTTRFGRCRFKCLPPETRAYFVSTNSPSHSQPHRLHSKQVSQRERLHLLRIFGTLDIVRPFKPSATSRSCASGFRLKPPPVALFSANDIPENFSRENMQSRKDFQNKNLKKNS